MRSFITKEYGRKQQNAFTLIEMLVSVGLFTIVMMVSLSVILSIVDGNKKAQAINTVVDNLNSSIDSMVRDMKTGTNYQCSGSMPVTKGVVDTNCPSVHDTVNFISTITGSERSVLYKYVPATGISSGSIKKEVCIASACGPLNPITSPEINITDMRMYVSAPQPSDHTQPGIFIILSGTAQINPTTISDFHIQTFVSQRVLNI